MELYRTSANTYLLVFATPPAADTVLERSQQALEGYEEVDSVSGVSQYTDTPPLQDSRHLVWYYRTNGPDGASSPLRVEARPDRYVLEAARLARRHLLRDVGLESHLFSNLLRQDPCPECYSVLRQERTKSQCATCDGSGFLKGFSDPIALRISYAPHAAETEQLASAKFDVGQIPAWTANEFLLRTGDILVRGFDRELFEVIKHRPTTKRMYLLRQNLILRPLELRDLRREKLLAQLS